MLPCVSQTYAEDTQSPSGVIAKLHRGERCTCKVPINPPQIRVVLWVKTCSYPVIKLSLDTGYDDRVVSSGRQ